MIALHFALLLLAAPVHSRPEESHERNLGWNKFWSQVTDWFNKIVDTGKKVWDHLELDVHFPKLTEALSKVIESCRTTFEDLGQGVQFIIDHAVGFWKDTTEGLKGKTPVEQIKQIIKNVDDIADCDFYTFEMMMDVKCDIDRSAFVSALEALHNGSLVTLVDQSKCNDGVQALEVEFDIDITDGKDRIPAFKTALEQFKPSQEATLEPFLTAEQPDAALSVEPSFCEAYEEGRKEFQEASDAVRNLVEEVADLIEAAKEEGKATRSFFRRFINLFKKDPVQEKKEQKQAELNAAEKAQAHGANVILGATTMCAEGTMRGPRRKDNGEPVCLMESRRLSRKIIVV